MPWKWAADANGWQSRTWAKPTTGKGAGKAAGKGPARPAPSAPPAERTCQRADCLAAVRKQATWGGQSCCFACKRPLKDNLPVEQLVDWAFQDRLVAKKAEQAKASPHTRQKHGDRPPAQAPTAGTDPNKLAALRAERLQALGGISSF